MNVRSVEFTGSFGYPHPLPREARPEVALFGRSNVGKSSLINTLLGRRGVARISKTPGKTRTANFFLINHRFYFVDMPGYGYAKVSKAEIARFTMLFEQYLSEEGRSNALIQIIDIRHDPTPQDVESVRRMSAAGRPLCLVFNKSDKVARGGVDRAIISSLKQLDVPPDTAVIPFSSVTGEGKGQLWGWIEETLAV